MSTSDHQGCQGSIVLDMGSAPYQPDAKFITAQELPNRRLLFQAKWFSLYPWLHYSPPYKKFFVLSVSKPLRSKRHP